MSRLLVLVFASFIAVGCQLIPDVGHQPVVHNPFPQLSRVAVAPFFNLSDEDTVDGRRFGLAYFGELQQIPGFEVVPLSVVEEAMLDHRIVLDQPGEARRLGQVLGVDAVVIGAVTDYSPYYPPQLSLRVEWYAVNPGFHEIPPGYGLPWGTPDEEFIPAPLVFEAEFALAKAQLETQTPACAVQTVDLPAPPLDPPPPEASPDAPAVPVDPFEPEATQTAFAGAGSLPPVTPERPPPGPPGDGTAQRDLPPGWPDERGFIPPGPSPRRPECLAHPGPVMTHTRMFRGNDPEFTEALASYYHFRDDGRFGGWQAYLQRSEDFISFCCHLHLSEMLTARGGAGKTRVVWRWSDGR